jgi:hypothetical protein
MFERFTSSARGAVIQARDEAVRACHERVGTEHLVIALADDTGIAGEVLRDAGVTANALRRALAETSTTPDVDLDADALRSLGIDLDDVRRSMSPLEQSVLRKGVSAQVMFPSPLTRRRPWNAPYGRRSRSARTGSAPSMCSSGCSMSTTASVRGCSRRWASTWVSSGPR